MHALLAKIQGDGTRVRQEILAASGGPHLVTPILSVSSSDRASATGARPERSAVWFRLEFEGEKSANPWDDAHEFVARRAGAMGVEPRSLQRVEPDFEQEWAHEKARSRDCTFDDQDPTGGKPTVSGVAWHLGDRYTQLAKARHTVGPSSSTVLIAHLDTGYDPKHKTLPPHFERRLAHTFVQGDPNPNDAIDYAPAGSAFSNPGHGTGTLSLLAGNRLDGTSPGWAGFKDYVGGAPQLRIMSVRIANWVVRFSTGTMVQGFEHAITHRANVLSMSMGGLPSFALADAVNKAYDNGILMVSAAGNNFSRLPVNTLVFPARFDRVIAACGIMGNDYGYTGLQILTMQGNYGPSGRMGTVLGAYTPNTPWAKQHCGNVVDMNGAGTSAATPQIAAAAALWLAHHHLALQHYSAPWMSIEAAKEALFRCARKQTIAMNSSETFEKIGQGVVQAAAALAIAPLREDILRQRDARRASAIWDWLPLALQHSRSLAGGPSTQLEKEMLALELTQMAQQIPSVALAMSEPDSAEQKLDDIRRYLQAAIEDGQPSRPLRTALQQALDQMR